MQNKFKSDTLDILYNTRYEVHTPILVLCTIQRIERSI